MARTLTAGALAWKAQRAVAYDVLVESETLNIRWAYNATTLGGYTWEHRLLSVSEIELSVPILGGLASANTVTVTVIESVGGNSLRGLYDLHGKLEGADLVISLLPAGETYANRIKLFTGRVDHAQWSAGVGAADGIGQLLAVDESLGASPLLPSHTLSSSEFVGLAQQEEGQWLPIVYSPVGGVPYVPTYLVHVAERLYKIADHPLYALANIHAVASEQVGGVFTLAGDVTPAPTTASITLNRPLTQLPYNGTVSSRVLGTTVNVTGGGNIVDGNSATQASLTPATLDANGEGTATVGVRIAWANSSPGMNVLTVHVQNARRGGALAVTSTAQTVVSTTNAVTGAIAQANVVRDGPYSWSANGRSFDVGFTGLSFGGPTGVEVQFQVINEGGAGGTNETWHIGEILATGRFQPTSDLSPFYVTGVGGVIDTDGHITGAANFPIFQSAEVIQSVLEHYLGLTIDTGSFTTAKSEPAWDSSIYQYAFGIGSKWFVSQIAGAELLDQLALQSRSYVYPSGAGTWKIATKPLEGSSAYDFTVSEVDRLRIETSRMEYVYHTYHVRYGWSPVTKQFMYEALASPAGCNHQNGIIASELLTLCIDSQLQYGALPPLQINAWAIQDRETAETLLQHLVLRHWTQGVLVEFEAPFVALHLEVSDAVSLTHPELPNSVNGQLFSLLRVTHRLGDEVESGFALS